MMTGGVMGGRYGGDKLIWAMADMDALLGVPGYHFVSLMHIYDV